MMSMWTKLNRAFGAFRNASAGNVAITFALASLPIVGSVGFAVDYSHANSVKIAMQAALDSTALMLSKDAAANTNSALQTEALNYFKALFTRPEATNVTITASYTSSGGSQVVVNGSVAVPTTFLGVIGYNNIVVNGSSTSAWGSSRLRVALVLDNTGSMADNGKMTALQSATKSLLTQLQNAASTNGDVYISIVPFVKDVNLGAANWNSNWIYWDDTAKSDTNSWDANNGTCSASGYSPRSNCLQQSSCSISGYSSQSSCTGAGTCSNASETNQSSCTGNKACSNSQYTSKNSCTSNGGTWATGDWTPGVWSVATWTPKAHSTWNGCVADRGNSNGPNSSNYDTNVGSPDTTIPASLYAAEQYDSCPQAVMGLNYNWSGMTSLVNNMSPAGNTNQAIGLQLGWMSLVGGGPFSVPAMQSGYTYSQIIILLTDGLNTQDRWYTSQNSIDARQQLTCNNIKAAGITLYTIQVNTGGDPTSALLQNCASTSDKFYLLTSASQIITAFTAIGTKLTQLRVAK
jgi:Flp pilus assembly protein TadG